MLVSKRTCQLALVGLLGVMACTVHADPREFDGVIEYRNRSRDTLYVSEVTGFERHVECGYLVPDGKAGLILHPMVYPAKTTIRWRIGEGAQAKKREVTLDLESLLQPRRDAVLVFEYSAEGKWTVRFEQVK